MLVLVIIILDAVEGRAYLETTEIVEATSIIIGNNDTATAQNIFSKLSIEIVHTTHDQSTELNQTMINVQQKQPVKLVAHSGRAITQGKSSSDSNPGSNSRSSSTSGGNIAGIVLGVLGFLGLLCCLCIC